MTLPTITPPSSSAPTPTDPSTFDSRMDAFVAFIFNFVTELIALVTAFNIDIVTINAAATTATEASTAAASAANFVGPWSSLSGAKNIPLSTSHSGKIWMLLTNVADVTATEPGVDPEWQSLTVENELPSFSGNSLKFVRVNAGETAAEYSAIKTVNGESLAGSTDLTTGRKLLSTTDVSSAQATIDLTDLDSTFDEYEIHIQNLVPASEQAINLLVSIDNGSNWITTATYKYMGFYGSSAATTTLNGSGTTGNTSFALSVTSVNLSPWGGHGMNGIIRMFRPVYGGGMTNIHSSMGFTQSSATNHAVISEIRGQNTTTTAVNAIRILAASGNIDRAIVRVYGVKK